MRLVELLEDSTGILSTYRFCFIFGTLGLFALATAEFCGYGSLSVSLYGILATMASGGYIAGKYNDRIEATSEYDIGNDTDTNQ